MHSAQPPIRPAAAHDCSSLAALSIEVWLGTYLRHGVSAQFSDYALDHFTPAHFEAALADPQERFLVSQNQQGIDGYIRLSHGRPCPVGGPSCTEISTLYVQPRHHGSGTGRCLLAAGLELCRGLGWDAPWLTTNSENRPAIGFYLRHGFSRTGMTHFQIGGEKYPNDVFQFAQSGQPHGARANALQDFTE
ncbi:GNAT family N-acetyltransferase [Leisingera sp.]|uniref:GNAT family N-acetyltransferase n=1 Tax=Leisingera sp. TaxID=1879318 RepID=UPI002B2791A9|nr:GNAT family N-acetyltransferase [Leisingera sp.]